MSNKRITDLTELTTPTTDDVFPVVDIATNTTTKVQLANLPVQTAVTTALATKQATLVSGTNIKTINSTTLLGSGDIAVQPTLVSGVSIKTVNSTSLLGSGDIPIPIVTPSGVSGAIQFSNGSAFASDASNFFWDNTNKRLGVCTNTPGETLDVNGQIRTRTTTGVNIFGAGSVGLNDAHIFLNGTQGAEISYGSNGFSAVGGFNQIGGNTTISGNTYRNGILDLGARLGIRGSGSTSATTSLLVQNSAGNTALQVTDDQMVRGYNATGLRFRLGTTSAGQSISTREGEFAVGFIDSGQSPALRFLVIGSGASYIDGYTEGAAKTQNYPLFIGSRVNNTGAGTTGSTTQENGTPVIFGSAVSDASALVQINSTTRGFLPPRMTTTQINAIASPANGLEVYNTTLACPCFYDGTAWRKVSHTTM